MTCDPASDPLLRRRILSLGDSYTIGEGVDARDRWPMQLAAQLRECGVPVAEPMIIAQTGWTTGELSRGIDAAQLEPPYDLVTLLIGVNDQFRGATPADYRLRFRALLDRAIQLAGDSPSCVIVLSIPDWSVTPFAEGRDRAAIAAALRAFNTVAHEESTRAARSAAPPFLRSSAHWLDITASSRRAAHDPDLLAADGLHPSAGMYDQWVRVVLPEALAIVERRIG